MHESTAGRAPQRSILLGPYSLDTEKMALGFFGCERAPWSSFGYQRRLALMNHVPAHPWAADRYSVTKAVPSRRGRLRFINKLDVLRQCSTDETILFDCDMVVLGDISGWFDLLGTDDFTFFNRRFRAEDMQPGQVISNVLNARAFCEHYGVDEMPTIIGGGHYFFRDTERGRSVLARIAEIMIEAASNPDALYWKLAGEGNTIGDEPAASMAVVELGIELPPATAMAPCPTVGMFKEGPQSWIDKDLRGGNVRFSCSWAKAEVTPTVIHFGHHGKFDPVYREFLDRVWAAGTSRFDAGKASAPA